MEIKTLRKGEILFRQGDPGICMYEVCTGSVGIYSKYGMRGEKLLRILSPGEYFGEMGLIDHAPRSAAAVALEGGSSVNVIGEEDFGAFFRENPARALMVMQHLSGNLRRRTNEYVEVCRQIQKLSAEEEHR